MTEGLRAQRALSEAVSLTPYAAPVIASGAVTLLPKALVAGSAAATAVGAATAPAWIASAAVIGSSIWIGHEASETMDAIRESDRLLKSEASGEQYERLQHHGARLRALATNHKSALIEADLARELNDGTTVYDFSSVDKMMKFREIIEEKIESYQPAIDANKTFLRRARNAKYIIPFGGGEYIFGAQDEKDFAANNALGNQNARHGELAALDNIIAFTREAEIQQPLHTEVTNPRSRITGQKIFSPSNLTPSEQEMLTDVLQGNPVSPRRRDNTSVSMLDDAAGGMGNIFSKVGIGSVIGAIAGLLSAAFLGPIGLLLGAVGAVVGYTAYDRNQQGNTGSAEQEVSGSSPKPNHARAEGQDPMAEVTPLPSPTAKQKNGQER